MSNINNSNYPYFAIHNLTHLRWRTWIIFLTSKLTLWLWPLSMDAHQRQVLQLFFIFKFIQTLGNRCNYLKKCDRHIGTCTLRIRKLVISFLSSTKRRRNHNYQKSLFYFEWVISCMFQWVFDRWPYPEKLNDNQLLS